ncbi:MAG: DNA-directed RNA polymerase subunit delta [Metamycoplasmataceae bacterium]
MNNTILSVIHSLFSNESNEEKQFTFQEIFDKVESILSNEWNNNNTRSLNKEELKEIKMGEIYKLLTLDGSFVRHEDNTWSKRKINET